MERKKERRTAALYELVKQAGLAPDLDSGLGAAVRLTEMLFDVRAAILLRRADNSLASATHPASSFSISGKEYDAVARAFKDHTLTGEVHIRVSELRGDLFTSAGGNGRNGDSCSSAVGQSYP